MQSYPDLAPVAGDFLLVRRVAGKAGASRVANSSMTSPRISFAASAQSEAVLAWRRDRLLAAGFAAQLAARLAGDCGVDLHALIELVDRGCPPQLAARILAPLDYGPRPC